MFKLGNKEQLLVHDEPMNELTHLHSFAQIVPSSLSFNH